MNNMKCPICNSDSRPYLNASDRHQPNKIYRYNKCKSCSFVFLTIRKPNLGFVTYNTDSKVSLGQKIVQKILLKRLQFQTTVRNKKILDYGAGTGNLASAIKKEFNADVECFEIDDKSRDIIRKKGLRLTSNLKKDKYDIVISEQVIEHVVDPVNTLKSIKSSLKKDGLMFISRPDINSLQARIFKEKWFHLDAPRHLNHFAGKSWEMLLKRLNLSIVKEYRLNIHMDPSGWYWSMLRPGTYNASLSNPKNLFMFLLFTPLSALTSLFGNSAYVLYVIRK